jgi:hypothetical protein
LEKTLDVFNITIARQQAEVEVTLHYLSISRNKSKFHVDVTKAISIVLQDTVFLKGIKFAFFEA